MDEKDEIIEFYKDNYHDLLHENDKLVKKIEKLTIANNMLKKAYDLLKEEQDTTIRVDIGGR